MTFTWFVDELGGNDSNSGLTFALRKKTLAGVATAGAAAGDAIRVMGTPSTSSGINATFTNLSATVTLASALTQSIFTTGAAWTASTNVTCTGSISGKLSATSATNIAIASAFTTGKAAFFATGTLNLSTYQQLSFWILPNASVASGVLRLDLCSDTGGATVVNSLTLPALTSGQWNLVTINNGANFGATIASIRLFCISDPGTVTVTIDDIIACKGASSASCLTLNSLISSDNATWYAIKTINGTAVVLDAGGTSSAVTAKGIWSGTTGSLALSILAPLSTSASGTGGANITDTFNNATSGTSASRITISGGWDTTNMTTQNGWTVFDGVAATATAGLLIGCDGVTLDHFVFTRFNTPVNLNGTNKKFYTVSNCTFSNAPAFFTLPSHAMTISSSKFLNLTSGGMSIPQSTNYNSDGAAYSISSCTIVGNTSGDGITVPASVGSPAITIHDCAVYGITTGNTNGFNISSPCIFYNNTSNDNSSGSTAVGFLFQNMNDFIAYNLTAHNNSGAQVQINNASGEIYTLDTNFNLGTQVKFPSSSEGQAVIYSWTQNSTAPKYSFGDPATGETSGNIIYAHRENGTAGNNSIYSDYGTITTTGVTGESGGTGWKLSPNANSLVGSPLRLNVGRIACPANVTTTVTYYAQVSASSGLTAQFRVCGGRYPGIGSPGTDTTVAVSGTSWTQYSLAVTPTEATVIDVFFEVWGSASITATVSGPVTVMQ